MQLTYRGVRYQMNHRENKEIINSTTRMHRGTPPGMESFQSITRSDIENLYRSSLYPSLSSFLTNHVGRVSPWENKPTSSIPDRVPSQAVGKLEEPMITANSQTTSTSKIGAVHSLRLHLLCSVPQS
jgi:hypothetical protein